MIFKRPNCKIKVESRNHSKNGAVPKSFMSRSKSKLFINMRKLKISLSMICFAAILLSSCSHRVLDFTLISSKNVDLTKGANFVRGKSRVKGKDMVHIILFIPTGQVNIKEAVDKAIESTPGCVALLDGVIYTKFWWIPYIYGQASATIEGLPLIDPSLAMNNKEIPDYMKIELGKNGEVKKVENLTSDQYFTLKESIVKESKVSSFNNSIEIK